MKLLKHTAERRGNSEVVIKATWRDHMRRPAKVTMTFGPLENSNEPGQQTLVEGDVKQVTDTLFAVAEMAWGMGWRPRGFPGALAQYALAYKIPPEEGL